MNLARRIFGQTHQLSLHSFGGDSYLFFPLTRGASTYPRMVACVAAANRGNARDMMGALTMATDSRVFHVAADFLPFDPRPEDIVLSGLASLATAQAATASASTGRITAAAHGFADGALVHVITPPAQLIHARRYYVRDATANDFKLAATPGGTAILVDDATVSVAAVIADPSAPPVKYRLTAANRADYHSHWRLTAEIH